MEGLILFTSIRIINYYDYSELWIISKINSYMSAWGYSLVGTCESPLQNEYTFDFEEHEPSVEELERNLKSVIFGIDLEIERYFI